MTDLDIQLHPEILRRDGKEQFAVLPWEEFVRLRELLEDARDVLLIEQAKRNEAASGEPRMSHQDVLRRFGIAATGADK
jgi:hypothetical protein